MDQRLFVIGKCTVWVLSILVIACDTAELHNTCGVNRNTCGGGCISDLVRHGGFPSRNRAIDVTGKQ